MATLLKQSTAVAIKLGPFLDAEDGVTAETSLTISQADVRLAKNDANWAQKSDSNAASHEENGWYEVALNTTDTNTLGTLIVAVNESGALPVWREFQVVPANVYDSLVAGSDNLQVDTTQWGGTAVASANVLIDGAITAAKIASNAITDAKIASGALTAAKFAAGAFDAVWSVATRLLTAGTNIELAKGTGVTGFNDLYAGGVRTAVGLASANLDTQLGTIDSNVDAVLEDTGTTLPGTLSTISGKIDTVDSVADGIKAVTDALPDAGALTSLAQASDLATVDGNVDAILEDTGTTLPGTLSTIDGVADAIKAVTDNLPDSGALTSLAQASDLASLDGKVDGLNDLSQADVRTAVGLASANLDTQLGTIDSNVDAVLVDTGTTIPSALSTIAGYIDTEVAAIKAVTDNLPDAGALTSIAQASDLTTVEGKIDTVDGVVDAIKAVTDNLPDSGALTSIAQASDLAATDAKIDDILEDTGTTLPGTLSTISGKVDGVDSAVTGLNDLSAAEVNAEVVDALATDTYAEPGQGAPGATISLAQKIGYLYKAFRNKHTQTADTYSLYNDAGDTVDQKAIVGDDGDAFLRGNVTTGA